MTSISFATGEYQKCAFDNEECVLKVSIFKAILDLGNQQRSIWAHLKKKSISPSSDCYNIIDTGVICTTSDNTFNFKATLLYPLVSVTSTIGKFKKTKVYKYNDFINTTLPSQQVTNYKIAQINTAKDTLNKILINSGNMAIEKITYMLTDDKNVKLLLAINKIDADKPSSFFDLMSASINHIGKSNPITSYLTLEFKIGSQILKTWGDILNKQAAEYAMTGTNNNAYSIYIPDSTTIKINTIYQLDIDSGNVLHNYDTCSYPLITYTSEKQGWNYKRKADFNCVSDFDGSAKNIMYYIDATLVKTTFLAGFSKPYVEEINLKIPLLPKDYNEGKFVIDLTK